MFEKVLIANRGAIAIRIARTCERLGIGSVAIYSEAEEESLHKQTCDEAVCVGPAPVQESYLNQSAIIEAAKATGAQAIHPGYGLLSENPAFARAVEAAGLAFIGPSADVLELFGDKVRSKALALQAGVRVTPGSEEALSDLAQAAFEAERVGYPMLVKAAGGGGGIGMQLVHEPEGLAGALASCADRARVAFGDDRLYIERYIESPRHIEVQVIGDRHGQLVALGERECSIQRHHQKLIEESPAPLLQFGRNAEDRRLGLFEAAVRIAQEAGFYGAGTAEFIVDAQGRAYFMEWNPRLQVEHAVTEMCTGLDLVELQLRIASGEALPNSVLRAEPRGHAIEARIYAEDATKDFAPRPGEVKTLRWPTLAPGSLRIESAIAVGSKVTGHYDMLVAKIITFGATRHQAILTLDRVLAETEIEPLATNLVFLRQVLANEAFRAGQYDTDFVVRLFEEQQEQAQAIEPSAQV
jgi:acetyl-CoA carboxylase biotin carboxylase subunit/3-methylcrotonyl-CoA carboxylase alpha subunit